MTNEFTDHIDEFIRSLQDELPKIYYQAFDFSNARDNRSQLMNLNYDKSKVSFLNLEMIADLFQVFTAIHSAIEQSSSRDFSVEVPYRLSTTKSVSDALRVFGGYGKSYMLVVTILDRTHSEELFANITQIEHVTKMSNEQMQECMKKNSEHIHQYYFGSTNDEEKGTHRNPTGEIVNKMIASKNL